MKYLVRQDFLIDEDQWRLKVLEDTDQSRVPLQAVACIYQLAPGTRAEQKILPIHALQEWATNHPDLEN